MADDLEDVYRRAMVEHGLRVRRARLRARRAQGEVASTAGVSRWKLTRMELGRGEAVPFSDWVRVTESLGLGLGLGEPVALGRIGEGFGTRAVQAIASCGGWRYDRQDGRLRLVRESPAVRRARVFVPKREVAVVVIADVVTDLERWIDRLRGDIRAERADRDESEHVAGLLVVRKSSDNHRRILEQRRLIDQSFRGNGWIRALEAPSVPMPHGDGMVWLAAHGTHLVPVARLS